MENENDIQSEDEIQELPEISEGEDDTTDWKARAIELEQKAIKQREKTKELKAELSKFKTPEPKQEEKKSSDFDYGQKAFLKTYGIAGADELALVKTFIDRTGDDIDSLVSDDIFNAKLKALRDAKAVKEATPESTKRSTGSTNNKTDYWLAKYQSGMSLNEVPLELRQEVLNARLKAEEQKTKFGS